MANAIPIPPPMHNAATPFLPPIRRRAYIKVTNILVPMQLETFLVNDIRHVLSHYVTTNLMLLTDDPMLLHHREC